MLNKDGAREWVADETDVVDALLSFAMRELASPSSGSCGSATRL